MATKAHKKSARRRNNAAVVEKAKVADQICRIIYEASQNKAGHHVASTRDLLYDMLYVRGAVDTHIVRGSGEQIEAVRVSFEQLEESGRIFYTDSDGVCELSFGEIRLQRIAERARNRAQQLRKAERTQRRGERRQSLAA